MAYDENAPLLVQRGYYPLPTAPVDFRPAKAPVQWIPSLGKFALLTGWNTRAAPIRDVNNRQPLRNASELFGRLNAKL
jgi:hypothetical protein